MTFFSSMKAVLTLRGLVKVVTFSVGAICTPGSIKQSSDGQGAGTTTFE
jgi:hypothetical protein